MRRLQPTVDCIGRSGRPNGSLSIVPRFAASSATWRPSLADEGNVSRMFQQISVTGIKWCDDFSLPKMFTTLADSTSSGTNAD